MHPYSENPNAYGRTRNWRDSLNIFEDAAGPEGKYNPVFTLHLLGGVVRQGLVGYITMVSAFSVINALVYAPQCVDYYALIRVLMQVRITTISGRVKKRLFEIVEIIHDQLIRVY